MYLRKRLLILLLSFFIASVFNGNEFKKEDALFHDGKYKAGLKLLSGKFNKSKPNPAVIWRISRMMFEIGEEISKKNKDEKIKVYTKGMSIAAPYLNIKQGTKRERAKIIYWYTVNFGSRGETIGIKESLGIIPELFKLSDKSLAIDPTFSEPYFMKAKIDAAVPFFLGGDKFRMGVNFSKAIKYDKGMTVLVDSADAFMKRNWSADKKKKVADKKKKDDGTPQNISDKEYAKRLLKEALDFYKKLKGPSVRQTLKYNKAVKMIKNFD